MLAGNSDGVSIHFELQRNESGYAEYLFLGFVDSRGRLAKWPYEGRGLKDS
jgi:hypothetical protein